MTMRDVYSISFVADGCSLETRHCSALIQEEELVMRAGSSRGCDDGGDADATQTDATWRREREERETCELFISWRRKKRALSTAMREEEASCVGERLQGEMSERTKMTRR